jgi:prolyl-tRNA editing enzyme YbaK/EbsC (Cys-tRNA(Pro) deacylase)
LGLPYEIIPIDPAFADTADFCREYGYPLERSGNTIVVATQKRPRRFAACVVPAAARLDVNHTVRGLLGGARASFASAEDMKAETGMEVGGVTPFSLPEEWPLYVDARLMALAWIVLGGGSRDFKVKLSPRVFERLGASVVAGLGLPPGAGPGG